jgi:hypothetical protein
MKAPFKKILTPLFISFIILSIIPAACGASASKSDKEEYLKKTKSWTIEYTVSGGFAGIHRQLTLNSSGKLTAADKKFKKHAEQQISKEQLMEIANILEQLDFLVNEKEASRLGGKCADCFQHKLILIVNGHKNIAEMDDISLRDSKYTVLIKLLSQMLEQAVKNYGDSK